MKLLVKASDAYYNKSNPIMSDAEFDKLYDEFKSQYPNDPFLKTIGSPVDKASEWKKATHKIPMESLNKVVAPVELNEWVHKTNSSELCASEKLDGISIDLEYNNGKLVKAITRGDGEIGEDITVNVVRMQNVRRALARKIHVDGDMYLRDEPFTGSLRGEIILRQGDFETINAIQKQRGDEPLKNLRNGASGIAKKRNGQYSEYCSIVYFDITGEYKTKYDKFEQLSKFRLPTAFIAVGVINNILDIYDEYENGVRAKLDHEIDGIVIETNDVKHYNELGELHKKPKGAVAYKFSSLKKETTILGVTWQLGNSGVITPVAELEPVEMGGVTVKRASLHNLENFKKLKPYKGANVLISRRGDVIPYVEKIIE